MLTNYESRLFEACVRCPHPKGVEPCEGLDIVLFWPRHWVPEWYDESGVSEPRELAGLLDRVFQTMCVWWGLNPNDVYAERNGVLHRLVFACDGGRDFIFGGPPRPYIGLQDGSNPKAGTADWFGWLMHELSHDFFHDPRLGPDAADWGEGIANYCRFHVLRAFGMVEEMEATLSRIQNASKTDEYNWPAKLLLNYERGHLMTGPKEVFGSLKDELLRDKVGPVTWHG